MKDLLGYRNKICAVTGAASGMGKACAEKLAALGAVVYALDIIPVHAEGIYKYVEMNMGDPHSIDEAFAQLPEEIDRFFSFAGVSGEKTSPRMTILINYLGNRYMMDKYLGTRIRENGAVLICTSVGANRWYSETNKPELEALVHARDWAEAEKVLDVICEDLPPGDAYTYSKRALAYYTALFACRMVERKVRVNCLKPGNTESGLTREFIERYLRLYPDRTEADYHKTNGLRPIARPDEMAEPAIFLNSDMASYISGAELIADYGTDAAVLCGIEKEDRWTGRKLVHMYS